LPLPLSVCTWFALGTTRNNKAGANGEEEAPDPMSFYEREKLIGSVVDGDVETVKACLLGGTPVMVKDEDGRTPLHFAVENSRKACVKVLMAHQLGQLGKVS
jgi:hypothetical protein